MDGKMFVSIGLILSLVLPISILAIPALADVNGTDNGEQVKDQERLGGQDCSYEGAMLQERERLRLHEQDGDGECTGSQHRERQGAENRIFNNEANCEQHWIQNREGTRKRGL